jgi:site-specific DNA-cytosine methylase
MECLVPSRRSTALQRRSDPNGKLPTAIMTSGCGNHHWSGLGAYSLDTLKVFQEFPPSYHIVGSRQQVVKQIENAVPSRSYSAYAAEIRKTLEDVDAGIESPYSSVFNQALKFRREQFAQPEIIMID